MVNQFDYCDIPQPKWNIVSAHLFGIGELPKYMINTVLVQMKPLKGIRGSANL